MDPAPTGRILLFGAVMIAVTFGASFIAQAALKGSVPDSLQFWNQWDAPHYLDLARFGYLPDGEQGLFIVFFPFYPLLVALTMQMIKDATLSGLLVSNGAYLASLLILFRLSLLDGNSEHAWKSLWYLSIFPTAVFLHAPYTESMFLATTLGSFYFARKQKWLEAGLLGALASATRLTGIVLLPALAIEYLSQKKYRWKNIKRSEAVFLLLIPLGLLIYLAINQAVFQDVFHFAEVQKSHWYETAVFPWEGFLSAWASGSYRAGLEALTIGYAQVVFSIFGLLMSLYAFRIRASYGVFALLTWIAFSSISFWISVPRYMLVLFPAFLVLTEWAKSRPFHILVSGIFIALHLLYLALFVTGTFVS